MYADIPLQVIKLSSLFPAVDSKDWAVVQDVRGLPRDPTLRQYPSYGGGIYACVAVCPTEEAARAALRLLSL